MSDTGFAAFAGQIRIVLPDKKTLRLLDRKQLGRNTMIERKWKPENHKLEDAFFPVELCDLKFVY